MMDNVSVITTFFLSGLSETKNIEVTLFCITLLCYCMVLLTNVSVIVIIITDKHLHEPMYILLCILCLNGLYGTTGFYPKFLWDLLSPVHVISYSGCLVQIQVLFSFSCIDLSILAVMAYDRTVAICQPLQYHSVMSSQRLIKMVCYTWITPLCSTAVNIYLTSRLYLCDPHVPRLFCVDRIIAGLACFTPERFLNDIVSFITVAFYFCHVLFIFGSYLYLTKVCANCVKSRARFMQTCVPHVTSLFVYTLTFFTDLVNTNIGSKYFPQQLQNFIQIEFFVIPPVMNPLLYGFKLTKIRNRIWAVLTLKMK